MPTASTAARRNVRLLWTVAFIGNLNFQAGLWIIFLRERGFSFAEIGLLQTGLSVATLAVELPAGVAADRFGRRPILLIARLLIAAYMAALAFTADPVLLALAFAAFGAGLAFESGADLALLVESVEAADERAQRGGTDRSVTGVVGRYYALSAAGMAIGLAIGGALQQLSWQAVFAGGALAQLIAFAITFRTVEIVQLGRGDDVRLVRHLSESLRLLRGHRGLGSLAAGLAVYIAAISLVHMFAQDILARAGIAIAVVSLLYAIEAVLSTVAAGNAGRIEGRLGRRVALLAAAAVSLGLVLGVGSGLVALAIGGFLLLGATAHVLETVAQSDISEGTPERYRATVLSAVSFGATGLMAILTPIIGLVGDASGLSTSILLGGGLAMAFVFVSVLFAYSGRRPTAATV